MQPPTVRETVGRLKKEGWEEVRTSGDHRQYRKGGKMVTVSGRMGDHLKRGTYASIKKSAGW